MFSRTVPVAVFALILSVLASSAMAAGPATQTIKTQVGFDALWERLETAVKANGMFVITRASASRGAAGRDIEIPGNLVIGVYRNDFAVRMLAASIPAGIEAPLRFYVTENADGTASLTYHKPSDTFAPYGSAALDKMAAELDTIWEKIVKQAAGG
ncbi:MAG: DUF302 domain-containing protein [Alphaproteobacteria bacterium]|nr:DUF302 domain-containing protein [Alphaproteobacteria bacterium]